MSTIVCRRRGFVLATAAWASGLQRIGNAHAEAAPAPEASFLSAHLATRVVYLQVNKIDASTGAVYIRECTGCIIGKDGWVVTAAHTFSDPILNTANQVVQTRETPEVSASIGERDDRNMERMSVPVVVDKKNDFALLQFKNFSYPRQQLLLGRASDVGTGDRVRVSGFMYPDKPRTTMTMEVQSKGGDFPFWNLGGEAAPGFSGSPIMNEAGHLVGIFSGGDRRPGGGNYGIPINLFHDQLAVAEPIYADGTSWVKGTDTQSTGEFQRTYIHKFQAPPVKEESVIARPFTKTYLVPPECDIVSASFYVNDSKGLIAGPMVTVDARNVSVVYTLQSGPRSSGKVGSLDGTLTMELTKRS